MGKAYLNIRLLNKYKLYTYINILGLALSLACVIIISSYIYQEVTTDHFIKDIGRVYIPVMDQSSDPQPHFTAFSRVSSLRKIFDHPAIEFHTEFINKESDLVVFNNINYKVDIYATDESFLEIMTYPVLESLHTKLLKSADEAIVTSQFAAKIFGEESPLGKKLLYGNEYPVTITGVIKENVTQRSGQFDLLLHKNLLPALEWDRLPRHIVKLLPGSNPEDINNLFNYYVNQPGNGNRKERVQLYPIKKFYLDLSVRSLNFSDKRGDLLSLIFLSIIMAIVLFMGIFNFIHMFISLKRNKEFHTKYLFGASSREIYYQILFENYSLFLPALLFGWIIEELLSGYLWRYLKIDKIIDPIFNIYLSLFLLVFIPLIASIYPFLRYSINAHYPIRKTGIRLQKRTLFVSLQYIMTFSLIILSLFFIKQLNFMINHKPGFETENILVTQLIEPPTPYNSETRQKYRNDIRTAFHEMSNHILFKDYMIGYSPFKTFHTSLKLPGEPDNKYIQGEACVINERTLDFFGFEFIKGTGWEEADKSVYGRSVFINETAERFFQFRDLDFAYLEAERPFIFLSTDSILTPAIYKVKGVVKNFHIDHLSKKIPPMFFFYYRDDSWMDIMIKLNPEKMEESIEELKNIRKGVDGKDLIYRMLSDDIKDLYEKDRQIATLCFLFTLFTIIISLMGVFSVSLFEIQKRIREIAIRKVNGAQPEEIFQLLMKKYIQILLSAFFIASVISLIILYYYLRDFENKTSISAWIFLLAFFIPAGMTWLTLAWQIRKAAFTNPTEIINNR